MPFFENSINNLISKIPTFKSQDGIKCKIKILFQDNCLAFIFISILDKEDNSIPIEKLDESQIIFFLAKYIKFIETNDYNRSQSIFGRFMASIKTSIMLIKNKKISNYYLSLRYGLPLSAISKFYTIDSFNNRCIANTAIENARFYTIMDLDTFGRTIPKFHYISLRMIYDLYLNENKYYMKIFEKIGNYIRIILPITISLIAIYNLFPISSEQFNLICFYIILIGISMFPKYIFRFIINFYIYKNSIKTKIKEKILFIKNGLKSIHT